MQCHPTIPTSTAAICSTLSQTNVALQGKIHNISIEASRETVTYPACFRLLITVLHDAEFPHRTATVPHYGTHRTDVIRSVSTNV